MKSVRSLALSVALATPLLLASPASASKAGQFCKKADNGVVKTADNGHTIRCAYDPDSEHHHWKRISLSIDGGSSTQEEVEESTVVESPAGKDSSEGSAAKGDSLAETGGSSATPYLVAGGAALLLGGGALALRRRRTN